MLAFARMLRRIDEVAAKLADILEQRAIAIRDVVPEFARGKSFADHDRSAANKQRAGRHHAADRVIHRQAIVHAIVRPGIHQAGEPKAPLHHRRWLTLAAFGSPGRAGRIDRQRAVGDRHRAALEFGQRRGRKPLDLAIDARNIRSRRATRFSACSRVARSGIARCTRRPQSLARARRCQCSAPATGRAAGC